MPLPFTREQFFDLFAEYNTALWPALVVLWVASAVVSLLLASSRRPPDRWVSALLAAHWTWSAVAYHAVFFTRINPAAWVFAALFLVQAGLFLHVGVVQGRLSFASRRGAWTVVAWVLVVYSLAYPAINAAHHLTWSAIPAFGVPCPTTLYTAGLLLLARGASWRLSIVPVIWTAIGGSAALVLGVWTDFALPVAGAALAVAAIQTGSARGVRRTHGASRPGTRP